MMVHGANPFINDSNADEVEKAFLKIPFIFSIAYHFDEPTQFADILLPESSNLERLNYYVPAWTHKGVDDELRSLTAFNFKHPVTKPVYNSRDANDILMQLAVMIGIFPPVNAILNGMLRLPPKYQLDMDPPRPFTWPEVMDRILKSRFGDDKGIEYFIEHGSSWTAQTVPLPQSYNYFYFPQGATRHPIYFENLKMAGDDVASNCQKLGISIPGWKTKDYLAFFQPMPTWVPHPEHEAPKEYDLYAINWKIASRAFAMGGMAENPVVREMQALFEPDVDRVLMNPKTARAKGFSDGDEIAVITTEGFKVKGLLRTTELLHPKVVGFAGNFGHKAPLLGKDARRGINYNQLLSAADGKFDPSVGGIDSSPAVKVVRA
jgi:anaerobic selenocysteine-containing dehydrogenase